MKDIPNPLRRVCLAIPLLGYAIYAHSLDTGQQSLSATVGATDYFKITCGENTDHFRMSLIESDVLITNNTPTIPPQILNAKLTKLKLSAAASAIAAGSSKDVTLKDGNGAYTLSIDTVGTNLSLKTAQSYTLLYRCVNAQGSLTTGSSTVAKPAVESVVKKLANNASAKYIINCAKHPTLGNTAQLTVKLTNKTVASQITTPTQNQTPPLSGNLAAQIIKDQTAINTIGGEVNIQEGSGDYLMMVNSPINKAQNYQVQYNCLSKNNTEIPASGLQILQNQ